MDLAGMQAYVSALAGDESNVQFSATQIYQYLSWGQQEICRRLELCQEPVSFTALDAGAPGGVALPSDFSQELHVFWGGSRLSRMDYASFYNDYAGTTSTDNAAAYTVGGYSAVAPVGVRKMLFWPYQTASRTGLNIEVIYTSVPNDITIANGIVLPTVCHEALCLYALARCKLQENDYPAYQLINKDVYAKLLEMTSLMNEADGFSYPVIRSETSAGSVTLDG